VQIDTINVIERCHHHILFTRIPSYERAHLRRAQTCDKSVFEYLAHALAYIPVRDIRYYLPAMRSNRRRHAGPQKDEIRKIIARIRREGALSIRDIEDDILVEKDHAWASRKPSARILRLAFYGGEVTVSARTGIVKTYDLMVRHFGWEAWPKAASEREILEHLLERALRAQGVVSLDSICYGDAPRKPAMHALIEKRVREKRLVPVVIDSASRMLHWARPETVDTLTPPVEERVHILSPFDPLIIQRKRLALIFGYEHRFEAYVPKAKREFGYFALPVLVGDRIVAAIDLKTDRTNGRLLIQQWTWLGGRSEKKRIEEELHRFEAFQLAQD